MELEPPQIFLWILAANERGYSTEAAASTEVVSDQIEAAVQDLRSAASGSGRSTKARAGGAFGDERLKSLGILRSASAPAARRWFPAPLLRFGRRPFDLDQ